MPKFIVGGFSEALGFNSPSGTPYRPNGTMEIVNHAATTDDEG